MPTMVPDFLYDMLLKQYGAEVTGRILQGYAVRRPVTLRVNTLKADKAKVTRCLREAGISYLETDWYEDALILEEVREEAVQRLSIYENGEIYLQSLSSMIPPLLLNPAEKETILDMTAAPGSKTTQIAALSGNRAQITACEKNKIRADRLRYNLEKQGAMKVFVMNEDARKLDPLFSFDKILLDAPCSGSGTLFFGEDCGKPDRTVFTKELIDRSVRTQEALLKKALALLKPGREMIYSTCSILAAENEQLLRRVLPGCRGKILPIEHPCLSFLPLLPTTLPGTCCICPTEEYEGFFVARIRKNP